MSFLVILSDNAITDRSWRGFNSHQKETKRIILSHSRTFEDAKEETKKAPRAKRAAKKEEAPVINNVAAGTTLGDIDALAELKAKLEKGE